MIKKIIIITIYFQIIVISAMKQSPKSVSSQEKPLELFARLSREEQAINKSVGAIQSMQDPQLAVIKKMLLTLEKKFPTELEWVSDVHENVLNNLLKRLGNTKEIFDFAQQLNSFGALRWRMNSKVKPI